MPKKKVLYYQNNDITILNDDILKTTALETGSVDLVVTSPPYNVDIQYNSHKDDVSYPEYLEFSGKWLAQCFDFLRDDGPELHRQLQKPRFQTGRTPRCRCWPGT